MKQWIIDRYNKGQNKYDCVYEKTFGTHWMFYKKGTILDGFPIDDTEFLYDFLFNPKWGFALAFSKTIYDNEQSYILTGGHNLEKDHTYEAVMYDMERELLQEMAVAKNPLKYLECFK